MTRRGAQTMDCAWKTGWPYPLREYYLAHDGLRPAGRARLRSPPLWIGTSVVSQKFIEEQPQILRLTTPELKNIRGPVRSDDSGFCVA